jgi:uncharacterized protein YndB with AHSA1/START domain
MAKENSDGYRDVLQSAKKELVIVRDFNAPCSLVFKAFAEAEALARWWGPKGSKIIVKKLDFKPGGIFHYSMEHPEGGLMWGKFVYRDIVSPQRIVFVNSFADELGNVTPAPFDIPLPVEILYSITLTETKGKTTLTVRGNPVKASSIEQRAFEDLFSSMQEGFGGTFDQLEEYLSKISSH